MTGNITEAGGISTLTLINGCPTNSTTSLSFPLDSTGNLSTTTTSSGAVIVGGGAVPNLTGTYQGNVIAYLSADPSLGYMSVPMTLFVTETTSGTVQAILSCGTCETYNEITFNGTVIGGGFHGTSSFTTSNGTGTFTIDADPVVVDNPNMPFGSLAITTNSLAYQLVQDFGLASGTFTSN